VWWITLDKVIFSDKITKMSRIKRISLGLALAVIVFSVIGYFLFTYMQVFSFIKNPHGADFLTSSQFEENKVRVKNALRDIDKVSEADIVRGFWYTYIDKYGESHVYYFDAEILAGLAMSDKDLQAYVERLSQSEISSADSIRELSYKELPDNLQFHNAIYGSRESSDTIGLISMLELKLEMDSYSESDLEKLIYLYELKALYEKRDKIQLLLCKDYAKRCDSGIAVTLVGKVIDGFGEGIQGARVEVLSRLGVKPVLTNMLGEYHIQMSVQEMEKIRLRANKRNYSDGVVSTIALSLNKKVYSMDDLILTSPINIITINTQERIVTGEDNTFDIENKSYIVKTKQSKYTIPFDSIVHKDGSSYAGIVDVYLYEFAKGEVPESLMAIDTFDDVRGYAGNLMKTFGMPYIQFFSPDGEELHVFKTNPMKLEYKIYNMDALYTNQDKIYEELTQEDMIYLAMASGSDGYPIDRLFLIQHDMLRFPAFWVFDRTKGIWENVGVRVIDPSGIIESIFYTINDSS